MEIMQSAHAAKTEAKVVVKNLYKVFGNNPQIALKMLQEGLHKDEILKQSGQVIGVQNASFEINQGEIFVIMGLSGSGKSTLIRLLNRLIEPSAGNIIVDGEDVASMSKEKLLHLRRKDMSMVFQSFALLPHRTVVENAAFGLEIAGVKQTERERRAMQVLEQVGLHTFAKHLPSQLSGGMQQRVGLARALTVNPSLMLMDEAFSALDPLRRTEMQDVLMKLQQDQKRTIVFVSHDLDEALRIGNRICIMEGGRVVQVGTSEDILQRPADDYVKAFFNGVDVNKHLTAKDVAQKEEVTIFDCPDDLVAGFSAALARMRLFNRDYAFVLDKTQKLVGVVSAESITHCMNQQDKKLRDALLPGDFSISGKTPVNDVLNKAIACPCPLPVIDGNGEYIGAITKTVLLRKLYKESKA